MAQFLLDEDQPIDNSSLTGTLAMISSRFKLNPKQVNQPEWEIKLDREATGDELREVEVAQLGDDFSRFERNRDMVRFNLYKACLV